MADYRAEPGDVFMFLDIKKSSTPDEFVCIKFLHGARVVWTWRFMTNRCEFELINPE
jgi:hypothetical protein